MSKTLKILFILLIVLVLATAISSAWLYLYPRKGVIKSDFTWGVAFSQMHAEYLQLNWREVYLEILDDLGVRYLKLHTTWDWVEGEKDSYFFNDIDWQLQEAKKRDVHIIYVIGMKTGRWPECHIPAWAQGKSKEEQQRELLEYITQVVDRYKNSKSITHWQVENEPFFRFGECPLWYYDGGNFLKTEVNLVKALDPSRPIIISDSGEQSNWVNAAKVGDVVGTTMYRRVLVQIINNLSVNVYAFLSPNTYLRKVENIKAKFNKEVICIELQAEPWASKPIMEAPLAEQLKSMNPAMFQENVIFAKKTGINEFYFWGAEWWYWLKEKHGQPEIWNEAKQLFKESSSPQKLLF